jgi:hypothetical protein
MGFTMSGLRVWREVWDSGQKVSKEIYGSHSPPLWSPFSILHEAVVVEAWRRPRGGMEEARGVGAVLMPVVRVPRDKEDRGGSH